MTSGQNSDGYQTTSEIVDLTVKGGNKCNNWPDFPIDVAMPTGGLIGNTVIICGGYNYNHGYVDECYSLTSEKATLVTHMSVSRIAAASIVFNYNALWVTGGSNHIGGLHASTEYVTITKTMSGSDLPMALEAHAMVALNSTCSMVIGGNSNDDQANYCSFLLAMVKNSEYLLLF